MCLFGGVGREMGQHVKEQTRREFGRVTCHVNLLGGNPSLGTSWCLLLTRLFPFRAEAFSVKWLRVCGKRQVNCGVRAGLVQASVHAGSPLLTHPCAPRSAPHQIPVVCSGVEGTFSLPTLRVQCHCEACSRRPSAADAQYSATQWEQHCGAGSAKKWKASIRIVPGGVPEIPASGHDLPIGRWLEMMGIETKGARSAGGELRVAGAA